MNLAGQLVISKSRFAQISEELKHVTVSKQTPRLLANAISLTHKILADTERRDGGHHSRADMEAIRVHARRMQIDLDSIRHEITERAEFRTGIHELFDAVHQLDRVADGIQKSVMETRMVPIGPLFGRFRRVIRDITRASGKDIQLSLIHISEPTRPY